MKASARAIGMYLMLLPAITLGAHDTQTFVSLQFENDFFASSGDRYYTHGFEISMLRQQKPPAELNGIEAAISHMATWFPFYRKGDHINLVSYTLGHKMFTPDDLKATELIPHDRPYAGYLYASAAILSQYGSNDMVDYGNMFEVTLGLIGPSALSEDVHVGAHKLFNSEIANGWDYQLKNEVVFGLSYSRVWSMVLPAGESLEFGIAPNIGIRLGTAYTYGAGGVVFRLGENLRRDLAPPNISPGFPGMGYFRAEPEPSWYAYLGFESRIMARNIFLDGNTFQSSHSVDRENLIGDMQFGLVYMCDGLRISYSNMLRTKEFDMQRKNVHYGAINISFILR